MQIAEPYFSHYVKPLVFGLALLPALYLAVGRLGAYFGCKPYRSHYPLFRRLGITLFADYFKHFQRCAAYYIGRNCLNYAVCWAYLRFLRQRACFELYQLRAIF